MSVTAFLLATAALVGMGVSLRRLLPRDGFAALGGRAEQAAGG